MEREKLKELLRDREEALLSLDRTKIEEYAAKYGVKLPKNEVVFWAGIHKARLEITDFPWEAKMASRHWLRKHGFKTMNGEEP